MITCKFYSNFFKLFIAVILIIIELFTEMAMTTQDTYAQNQFGITGKDSFCLSHFYNVNGVVGYKKTDFTSREKQELLAFIASLEHEVILETEIAPEDIRYGIPEVLTVRNQGCEINFALYGISDIEVSRFDRDGNVVSRKQYTTTTDQLKNLYYILGFLDKALYAGFPELDSWFDLYYREESVFKFM